MTNHIVKKYLYSNTRRSGQIVIVCEQYDIKSQAEYRVRAYYHYEQPNQEERCFFDKKAKDKDVANNLFKSAIMTCR